jgi:hypothetical protein
MLHSGQCETDDASERSASVLRMCTLHSVLYCTVWVLVLVILVIMILWDVTSCSLVDLYQRFEEAAAFYTTT